jgi:hypothetical protein
MVISFQGFAATPLELQQFLILSLAAQNSFDFTKLTQSFDID